MTKQAPPARLFAALSQDPTRNIILRRGPSRQVALFLWDRKNNSFTLGQWLKGRVFEHRLDLSPDGQYMIYLALQKGESHTVVSRPPYFTALDYYEWGGTWGGGGLFLPPDNMISIKNAYRLNGSPLPRSRQNSGLHVYNEFLNDKEKHKFFYKIYPQRLRRDGWTMETSCRFTKSLFKDWKLVKYIGENQRQNRSLDYEYHALQNVKMNTSQEKPDWEWADIQTDYLYFAEKGCVFKAKLHPETGIARPRKLHDFNDYKFEERRATY